PLWVALRVERGDPFLTILAGHRLPPAELLDVDALLERGLDATLDRALGLPGRDGRRPADLRGQRSSGYLQLRAWDNGRDQPHLERIPSGDPLPREHELLGPARPDP